MGNICSSKVVKCCRVLLHCTLAAVVEPVKALDSRLMKQNVSDVSDDVCNIIGT